jgi:hypothetical protein
VELLHGECQGIFDARVPPLLQLLAEDDSDLQCLFLGELG